MQRHFLDRQTGSSITPWPRIAWPGGVGRVLGPLLLALLLAGCSAVPRLPGIGLPSSAPGGASPSPAATARPSPTPVPKTADQVAAAYFQDWQAQRYAQMYDLLSPAAQASISRDDFVKRYTNIEQGIGQQQIRVVAQPAHPGPLPTPGPEPSPAAAAANGATNGAGTQAMVVPFQVTRQLQIFGPLQESNQMTLVSTPRGWRVDWSPSLIFKDLSSDTRVSVSVDTPPRGRILDRNGTPLADNGNVLEVGVIPGQVKDASALEQAVGKALGIDPSAVHQRYQNGQPDWFMPIGERPESDKASLQQAIGSVPGVALKDVPARVYPLGPAAAHLVGYVGHPSSDELKTLASQGYDSSDWIGRSGIEQSEQSVLAGKKGGSITITSQQGGLVRTIARKAAVHGSDVQLTIDARAQTKAFQTLGSQTGSIVQMDPRDNSIVAMASTPSFDPNQFIIGVSDAQWQQLNGPSKPLLFRATEATYPTGSIFKIITMTAGMAKGGFKTTDTFNCGLDWNGLPGVTLHNWTAEGTLNLVESLTESCDPAFYTIGLKLDQTDPNILPSYARQFGLGQPTGIQGVPEAAGIVPDPAWKQKNVHQPWVSGDSVNLAIGQGYLLATPLQMANAYAAFANGGTLKTPVVIKDIKGPSGTQTFQAKVKGQLPTTSAIHAAILEGMSRVTSTPAGTAYYAFRGERVPIAAKTGSAQNETKSDHAWFVGYETPTKPTLLTLVMIEGGQHGGTVAAPEARTMMDAVYPLMH